MKFRHIAIAIAAAAIAAPAYGQQSIQTQVNGQQRIAPSAAVKCIKAQKDTEKKSELVPAYIHLSGTVSDEALAEAGAQVSRRYGNIVTARIDASRIADIAAVDGVEYVETGVNAAPMLDVSRPAIGMDAVQSGEAFGSPYTGKGVVIGIVDSGFDYGHAAFRDSYGNLRIKRVWEQATAPAEGQSSPAAFDYGVEFTNEEDILAAEGDIRNNSHGTHVASIAAGSDEAFSGALRGMAPEAEIVLVSISSSEDSDVASAVSISDAIAYIFDYADEANMPCVVNLSLGNHSGPHDGTSTFDQLASGMQEAGRLIVGSAGNHRADRFHVRRVYSCSGNEPLRTFIDYKSTPSKTNLGGDVEIWCSEGAIMQVDLVAYKIESATEIERVKIYPAEESTMIVTLGRNITGSLVAASEVSPLNGKEHVLITSAVEGIRTGYGIAIEVFPMTAGAVDIWADNIKLGLSSEGVEGFVGPTNESTICEIGGTGKRILTVGSYTTRSKYTLYGETIERELPCEKNGELSLFSSGGPTADGRIKPEVTAPGCFISAAVSYNDNSGTILRSAYHWDSDRDYTYGYMQGTSMSAPMVTGIVATWLQACPDLTPEQLREIVAETAITDQYTGEIIEPLPTWGYGKINPQGGLAKCIELAGIPSIETDVQDATASAIYNLQGQKVRNNGNTEDLPTGLYINKGAKIWIK